jgi:integrase
MADPKAENDEKKIRGVYENPKGSGIWWIQYFTPERHRERVGRKSDAIKLYGIRRADYIRGLKMPELQKKRVTLGDLMDDAIVYARENDFEMRSYEGKAKLLRKAFGNRPADDVKPDEIVSWIRKRGVGPATFNRYRSFLSLCYREGMRHGKVSSNPARLLGQKKEPTGRKRYLNRKEYEAVLEKMLELKPDRVPSFIISVHTGMRLMEQFSLKWKHVDMDAKIIHIIGTRRHGDRGTKNGEDRDIPMVSVVFDELEKIRPTKPGPGALVFPRPRGGTKSAQPRWFDTILTEDGVKIEDYTWHNNRHTFCSWLAIAGTPLRTIQELAGHKTLSITARYAHLSPDHKATEIEKMVNAGKPKLLEFPRATGTANR